MKIRFKHLLLIPLCFFCTTLLAAPCKEADVAKGTEIDKHCKLGGHQIADYGPNQKQCLDYLILLKTDCAKCLAEQVKATAPTDPYSDVSECFERVKLPI